MCIRDRLCRNRLWHTSVIVGCIFLLSNIQTYHFYITTKWKSIVGGLMYSKIFDSRHTKAWVRIYSHKICDSIMRKISIQYSHMHLGFTVVFSLFFQSLSDNQALSLILPPSPQSVLLGYFKVLKYIWRSYCLNSDILVFGLESLTPSNNCFAMSLEQVHL